MRYVLKATEQDEYAILTLFGRYEPIASVPQISAVDPSARAGYPPQVPRSRHLLPAFLFFGAGHSSSVRNLEIPNKSTIRAMQP